MNPIDIIKEALKLGREHAIATERRSIAESQTAALTALDSLTVKVSDDEIERIALLACKGETSQIMKATVPNGPIPLSQGENIRRHIAAALRHARDRWLAPSPWISFDECELGQKYAVNTANGDWIFARFTGYKWEWEEGGTDYTMQFDPAHRIIQLPK